MSISDQDNVTPQIAMPVPSLTKIPKCENYMTPSHLRNKRAYHTEKDSSLPNYEHAMVMSKSLHM